MSLSRFRLLAPFLATLLVLALSLAGAWIYFQGSSAGLSGLVQSGLQNRAALAFARSVLLREVLPLYLSAGILLWLLTLGWGAILHRTWSRAWTFSDGFWITLAAFLWIHVVLWWRVPTALWVAPVLGRLPFFLAFPLLALAILGPLAYLNVKRWGSRGLAMVAGWLILWTGFAQLPLALGRQAASHPQGERPVQALILGVDGLRPGEATEQGFGSWSGTHYPHAYTMIPATRLFYSLLWGGDPLSYSVGHALPSEDELNGHLRYALLEAYKAKGLKTRFYIDDGGTIGLAGRALKLFDDTAMPAAGWENFINSNLAVHLPFYASWLDTLRVFPSTNPWSSLDAGLRAAVERGRGADLVMFHSCHLHQPIFLTRAELGDLPQWWTLCPQDLRPVPGLPVITAEDLANTDPRRDPLLSYRIRVRHLLTAWKPIWENLARDPDYAKAARVLLSDHGERFYHASPTLRLQGTHGYDLDPWELRVPFLVAGPGFPNGPGTDHAVDMLELRDALAERLLAGKPISPESFGDRPFAAVRYHTIRAEFLRPDPEGVRYLSYDSKKIVQGAALLPSGVWVVRYQAALEDRQQAVSLARAIRNRLEVFKPLEGGGAHRLTYQGNSLQEVTTLDEATFAKAKSEIEGAFLRPIAQLRTQ
jgi:hypothetical protein